MRWLAVLTLSDGSRVESSLTSAQPVDSDLAPCAFRLCRPDGSVHEFATLTSIIRYLGDCFDLDELARSVGHHEFCPELTAAPRPEEVGAVPPGLSETTPRRRSFQREPEEKT